VPSDKHRLESQRQLNGIYGYQSKILTNEIDGKLKTKQ